MGCKGLGCKGLGYKELGHKGLEKLLLPSLGTATAAGALQIPVLTPRAHGAPAQHGVRMRHREGTRLGDAGSVPPITGMGSSGCSPCPSPPDRLNLSAGTSALPTTSAFPSALCGQGQAWHHIKAEGIQ